MCRRTPGALCACLLVLSLAFRISYAAGETPVERARSASARLTEWLEAGKVIDAWRPLLGLDQLDRELAKGAEADPAAVAQVLGRFGADDPGLGTEPFVRMRQALEGWLVSLPAPPPAQLAAAARAAKSVFLPPTAVDLEDAKAELIAALDRLDPKLKPPAPGERDWKAFLRPGVIREQLARKGGPRLPTLDAAYQRFTSGHEGLGRVWFLDVRDGLRNYLTIARTIGDAKLRKQYEILLEALAVRLDAYQKSPTLQTAEEIDQALDWLDQAGQAKWLIKAVREQLSHPNVFVEMSERLVATQVAGPVDDTTPDRVCILKTDVHSMGHTMGNLTTEMVPSADHGQFDLVFCGNTASDSVGYRGKIQIFTNGMTHIGARKRLMLDKEKLTSADARSAADTDTSINGVCAGSKVVSWIAARRAEKKRCEAEYLASRHAEGRFNEQMDERAEKVVADANQRYAEKFQRPLTERRLFPELLRFSSTDRALEVTAMQIGEGAVAAPASPPKVKVPDDLSVRIHQTAVNNVTASALGGMILDEKRFQQILTENYGAPKRPPEEDGENWAITFARRQPVILTFGGNRFTATIRGRAYSNGQRQYSGMDVTATYRIERGEKGLKAVREGKLVIFPPGPRRQLSAREQSLRTILEHRFGKFFEPEIVPKNLVLKRNEKPVAELQLSGWETTDGWLLLTWKQVPLTKELAIANGE